MPSAPLRRLFVAVLVTALAAAALVVEGSAPARAVGADDPIMGPDRVTAAQMVAWFRANTRQTYRAGAPLEQLASLYLSEGRLAGVRGDIAFTQSILETGWFTFPGGGMLTPQQNNFAGIGACDSCATGVTFPSVQAGIRAQMQQLRRYADAKSRSWNIGSPPVAQLWPTASSYDAMNTTHGWAPTWQSLSGTWASSLAYAANINNLYNSMWNYAGRPGAFGWSSWESPGGSGVTSAATGGLSSGVSIASWQANRLDVFANGVGGTLLHKWWDGASWSAGWEGLGSPPSVGLIGTPSAVSWTPNRIDVFARGRDNQLWTRSWDGQQWRSWSTLGGVLIAAPAAAAQSSGRLDVFVNGTDRQLWHNTKTASSWSGWSPLGGTVVGAPAAVSPASGRLEVFVRGVDNGLYGRSGDGTTWAGWQGYGGALTAAPAVSSWGTGRIDVFVRGTDAGLYHRYWNGSIWTSYEALGGALTANPGAVSWAPARIDVFVRGTDRQLWHRFAA